jgi:hypothetical protein
MPIRAYLVLHRTRLIWCASIALLVPFAVVLFTTSEGRPDLGVFWNRFCGCAPGKGDAFALLYASTFTALLIGTILALGNSSGNAYATTTGAPGFRSGMPYTLTRPMRRGTALFAPTIIALLAIVILPVLGFTIIFGWMRLVHAPALAFFPQALRLIPDAAVLPLDASLFSLLAAAHAVSSYLASISIGLLIYILFYSQRWLMLSRHLWVRTMAAFQSTALLLFPAILRRISPHFASWFFLIPNGQRLSWHPSASLLLIQYAIPTALMFWSWRTLQTADF